MAELKTGLNNDDFTFQIKRNISFCPIESLLKFKVLSSFQKMGEIF